MSPSPSFPARPLADTGKPKHAQLREVLEDICTHELKPGDMLPGERILEDTFGVSRITVRRAIGDLVASGKLKRARGKGTFVAPNPLINRLHLASFSSEMEAQQLTASSKILSSAWAPAPPEVAKFFGTDPSTPHTHLVRLRLGNGEPYAIDDGWYNSRYAPTLLETDVYKSVYAILDRDYGVAITDAEQTATAINASPDDAELLGLRPLDALLAVTRVSSSNDKPVEWCRSLYHPDRFSLKTHVQRA
ncbi:MULTISPECIES: GntR family transcriptional regulator [Corynebacterium]|uniref:GntR family transcriptional regulator n=1 Tax=Corynebacterium TaxID=1716 RepID=UPI00124D65B1|nr:MULTISPECIES: GntR family transcriptional regulator [Corynebacterium]